jgi:uncharacterized protein DUF4062
MPRQSASDESPLLIDRAAAAELPTTETVREWAANKRAFISSVMAELGGERQAAAAGIRAVGARPVMFEEFGGREADAEQAYLAEVESSDIYVGLLGKRYGKPMPSRFSATHAEYRAAEEHGLRIAVWTLATDDREGPQQSFLEEVRAFHVAPEFRSSSDLQRQVEERLKMIAAEDLAPWCKLGNIVFRASEVTDDGNVLRIIGRVRNDEVAHALEGLRGDQWTRGDHARFTWVGRSKYVRTTKVETTTTSARSKIIRLQLERVEDPRGRDMEMTIAGFTADDLMEGALRTALFGEKNPLANQRHMESFAEIPDPLQPLRLHPVSEEIIRPIAELLLTESIVGTRRANRIVDLKLGVAIRGARKCKLTWETPRRFGNDRPAVRTISGDIKL